MHSLFAHSKLSRDNSTPAKSTCRHWRSDFVAYWQNICSHWANSAASFTQEKLGVKSRFVCRRAGGGPCHPFPSPGMGSATVLVVHQDWGGERWVTEWQGLGNDPKQLSPLLPGQLLLVFHSIFKQ